MRSCRLVLIAAATACAQPAPPSLVPPATAPSAIANAPVAPAALSAGTMLLAADLTSDLNALEQIYRALHPGLLRYNTPAQVDALFADGRRELARDRTLGDAFVVLTRLTAGLRCGHSYPNFFNQSDAVAAALFHGPRLPFWFRWIDGEITITRNFSDRLELVPGTVVESVGGAASGTLLAALLPLARADGSNQDKRRAYLDVTGTSAIEAFDVLLPLMFPRVIAATGAIVLAVRTPDGQRATVRVASQSFAQRQTAVATSGSEPGPSDPLWKLEMITRGGQPVAYLRMASWVAYHTKWDWKGFLHATMTQLATAKVPALVIDLRGNEGGNDVGDELLAHVIDRRLPSRPTVRRVRFETVPAALRPMLDTWDPSFFELGKGSVARADGWRELAPDSEGSDVLVPRAPRYRGKLVVLTDASNSSATFQFAQSVQRAKLATLVGTSTGGSQRGINGGAFFFARLPRTKLEVDVPLIGTFPPGPVDSEPDVPDAGITPDVVVAITAADIATGRDPQLEAALDIATGKRQVR